MFARFIQQAAIEKAVVSDDTLGRFPDQNLADTLGRLPDLAIARAQGRARFINYRGAPFRWTAIPFDAIDVRRVPDDTTSPIEVRWSSFPTACWVRGTAATRSPNTGQAPAMSSSGPPTASR